MTKSAIIRRTIPTDVSYLTSDNGVGLLVRIKRNNTLEVFDFKDDIPPEVDREWERMNFPETPLNKELRGKFGDDLSPGFEPMDHPVYKTPFVRLFIGRSKNRSDDGNTILVDIGGGLYAFIGYGVTIFRTDTKIVKYVSEVGNSHVPYPFALDAKGNYYLMQGNVKLENVPFTVTNPYEFYYADELRGVRRAVKFAYVKPV